MCGYIQVVTSLLRHTYAEFDTTFIATRDVLVIKELCLQTSLMRVGQKSLQCAFYKKDSSDKFDVSFLFTYCIYSADDKFHLFGSSNGSVGMP